MVHQSDISLERMFSSFSAESLNWKVPFIATEMPPVSSLTTMAMQSLSCDMPRAARWRKPSSLGMSWL